MASATDDGEYLSVETSKTKSINAHYVAALIIAILLLAGLAIGIAVSLTLGKRLGPSTSPTPPGPEIRPLPTGPPGADGPYENGVVASGAGPCSEIGRDILKRSGTAVDSAIATLFCIGVYHLHAAGVGGGGFMVIYKQSDKSAKVVDFREKAPAEASPYMNVNGSMSSSIYGGPSVAVPGEVRGLRAAWKRHGGLAWKELVQPSIDLAREGFTLGKALHRAASQPAALSRIRGDSGLSDLLLNKTGDLKPVGQVLRLPALAKTLEVIRDEPDSFYTGALADKVAEDVENAGGIMTKSDLMNYQPTHTNALKVTVGEYSLFATPSPGSGAMLSLVMNILKGYNMTAPDGSNSSRSLLAYHRTIEAFKFAFAHRSLLGDSQDMSQVVANIRDPVFAESLRHKIVDNMTFTDPQHYGEYFSDVTDHVGAQVSVISPGGDAVSVTTTLNMPFGSAYRSNRTGIIYNNQMAAFSKPAVNTPGAEQSDANFIGPGKRPRSSTAPAIFVDQNGAARLVAGASGGLRVITAAAQVAMNYLWFNLTLAQSVDEPRLHHQLEPMLAQIFKENPLPQAIQDGLKRLGHSVKLESEFASIQATAMSSDGSLWGKSDTNDYGWAAGY